MANSARAEMHVEPTPASYAYSPGPPLSHLVDLIWFYETYDPPHNSERMLPTGTMEMVFDLGGGDPVISGPHSKPSILDTTQPSSVIGIHFKPGGAFPFIKPPVYELRNGVVPLDALWGSHACDTRDRLMEAPSLAQKFSVVEAALMQNMRRSLKRHPAVDFALNQFGRLPEAKIATIVDDVGLSSRRFIELFRSQVGLTPKMYSRILRFQRMLGLIETSTDIDWAESALDCGYYDQAHFIHDFQTFSSLTPSDYLRMRGEHLNHVPIA